MITEEQMMINKDALFSGTAPEPMSEACAGFATQRTRMFLFHHFIFDIVKQLDHSRAAAIKALLETARTEEEKVSSAALLKSIGAATKSYFLHHELLKEFWICRSVDNFLTYIAELLPLVFIRKPEILRSSEPITVAEVLRHSSMEDFINTIAEDRVQKLSYKGFEELSKYIKDRLGITLIEDQEEINRAKRFIEYRNLIIHNRGIVNKIFLSRVPNYPIRIGHPIKITDEEIFVDEALLARTAYSLEVQAAVKFGISQPIQKRDEIVNRLIDLYEHEERDS